MLDPRQFLQLIIRPAVANFGDSVSAHVLLLGTALSESGLVHLRQLGNGPALGLYQMEPATHDDLWDRYLTGRSMVVDRICAASDVAAKPCANVMVWNLAYATIMARLHYMRISEPLPEPGDAEGMAAYHKRYYNTALGKADPARNVQHFLLAKSITDQTR